MCPGQELDAGWFAAWLEAMNAALEGARDSEVPCGECTACCTSSQFVHIDPDETGTLARIPEELLFPALRLPREHFVMGYDAHVAVPDAGGRPVLHLPAPAPECRTYDCRIFAASGLAPDGAAPACIADQVVRWRFRYGDGAERSRYEAVLLALRHLVENPRTLGDEAGGAGATELSLRAIEVHEQFLRTDEATGAPVAAAPRLVPPRVGRRPRRRGRGELSR